MTFLTAPFFAVLRADAPEADRTAPAPPRPGPVLIQDSITAVNGTTLLHELWRRAEDRRKG